MTPFTFEEITLKETTIFLCRFNTFSSELYLRYLTKEEFVRLKTFKSQSRRNEFIASRILKHRIFGFEKIHYTNHGAPYTNKNGYISISHCKGWVGIALNKKHSIGLDLEPLRENIFSLSDKFLSEDEKLKFDIQSKLEVTKIWSAKEALYKLAGRKKIFFKTELLLDKDINKNWSGRIINPNSILSVNLNIFDHKGIIISINSSEIVENKRYI